MPTERPSPFTIPEPTFRFVEGEPSEPLPQRSMTVEGLIHNLILFADFYESASADIERASVFEKAHARGGRDANADYYQRAFRATKDIDRVRAYALSTYGEELTIGTARRILGDLIRIHKLSVQAAGELGLEDAMDRLDTNHGMEGPEAGKPPTTQEQKRTVNTAPVAAPSNGTDSSGGANPDRPKRDPDQPGQDRQNDIIAAINASGAPLTRGEIGEAMRLRTEGKLGANLAWMVRNGILVNIPQRGYWPADRPIPK